MFYNRWLTEHFHLRGEARCSYSQSLFRATNLNKYVSWIAFPTSCSRQNCSIYVLSLNRGRKVVVECEQTDGTETTTATPLIYWFQHLMGQDNGSCCKDDKSRLDLTASCTHSWDFIYYFTERTLEVKTVLPSELSKPTMVVEKFIYCRSRIFCSYVFREVCKKKC